MKIIKRDGSKQSFMPNKILVRLKQQSKDLKINADKLFQKVIPHIKDGMTATEIDEIIAFQSADLQIEHPDYAILGGRILITRQAKLLEVETKEVDGKFDSFAASTFLKKYSMKNENGNPIEIPSMMHTRVATHLYPTSFKDRSKLLTELYDKKINFATPILNNSGVDGRNGLISCNLTTLMDDSIDGINATLDKISYGSKEGSGIGLNIDRLRSAKSLVRSFKGYAGGVVRFADMVQSHMRFYKQGNRSGSCALYLSTWHKDIIEFLELRLPIGEELNRTRDLFTAVTIDDVFMDALMNDKKYYLFCPNDIKLAGLKPLYEVHGDEFKEIYEKAVELGIGQEISAKKIWDAIIRSQVESGTPYVFYKDNANKRNMQDNIGVVAQSNLCIEIMQASKPQYTPQCTLASVNLAEHSDLKSIAKSTKVLVRALNRVIDINKWSDDWSKTAGEDQRAIAIGVAGLADFFAKMKISFESEEAKKWNNDIFETMYKAAVEESMALALEEGKNYPAWENSRYSKGETYVEGWSPLNDGEPIPMRNSLLIGLMPTASSAILLGAFECFEPVTSNVFTRMVGGGEFIVVNKYLVEELDELGLWTNQIRDLIIVNEGSIQNIQDIPEDIRYRYKTVWEIPQKALLELAVIRNKYVDQSQSMNVYHKDAKYSKISSALVYAWKNGLKTGSYYTRTESKLGKNKKLSASENVSDNMSDSNIPKKPEDSVFTCAGGGCDA
jgi:ribonucleoside-diphosphate reductase alpha subunit